MTKPAPAAGRRGVLPLPALVAVDTPRLALLLLAVEPRLRGVVFAGSAGSGKSSLARGARDLRPDAPFVELPLGTDEEGLLGGIDLDATLQAGRRVVRPGLLARANGGILSIDAFNLLAESSSNALLAAIEEGEIRVEREGLSLRAPTQFALIGSYDPDEGPPRAHLLDRVGLIVQVPPVGAAAARSEIVRRHLGAAPGQWDDEIEVLRGLIDMAREQLPQVKISDDQQRELIAAAIAFGVQGQRVDLFAVLAARASAAVSLRDDVQREDLELAVRLVIMPRATQRPAPPPQAPEEQEDEAGPPPPEAESEQDSDSDATPEPQPVEELFEALAVELPDALDSLAFAPQRRGRGGSRGSTFGKRGRHVASVPGEVRGQRIDIVATLRAASRWQRVRPRTDRRVAIRKDDVRVRRFKSKAGSLFLFAVDASGSMALNRMREAKGAVYALLEQAYVHRDQVALVSFRGQSAELMLPPTASVELVRRAVDLLRTGGGTPLAATLLTCMDVADKARRRGLRNIVLVLLTDGRANIGLRADRAGVDAEVKQLAAGVAASGISSLVVDTQRSFVSQGSASRLAGWLGGRHLYLPGASGATIAAAARGAASAPP